jgi:hypothetical protein
MKKLIINADDLGLTPGVTRGIIDAHLKGIVTSTSALMNSSHIAESLASVCKDAPELGVGVHLVLTWGKPLLPADEVPSLVDIKGQFHKIHQLSAGSNIFNFDEVRAEWQAQIEAFIAAGRIPDHLDSHHHSSYSSLELFLVMLELAQEYNLPIRFPSKPEGNFPAIEPLVQVLGQSTVLCPQSCITAFYGDGVSMANLAEIISKTPEGVSELMCHPGYADSQLLEGSSYTTPRELELRILTSKDIKAAIEENGVLLARFSDL